MTSRRAALPRASVWPSCARHTQGRSESMGRAPLLVSARWTDRAGSSRCGCLPAAEPAPGEFQVTGPARTSCPGSTIVAFQAWVVDGLLGLLKDLFGDHLDGLHAHQTTNFTVFI